MSYRGPKCKLSRKLGVAITRKAALVMNKKPYAPGVHGKRRRGPRSEYAKQLLEKQKLRFQYNLKESQLRKYFKKANKSKGNTAEALVNLLEHRLDNVVFRSGLASTIYAARQLVSHGHITVDGKKVNIPSFLVNSSSIVSLREKSQDLACINESLSRAEFVDYLETDKTTKTVRFLKTPTAEEIPVICDLQSVVEYYSK